MKTWNDYKEYVKAIDDTDKHDMEAIEEQAQIITAIIKQRNSKGMSQRELAELCNMPQSSIARIETMKTAPNIDTLLKIFHNLGLKLTVTPA
ncbi:helix-turn-helix domain-containing protein [Phascolarctobacterium sp.]|uniref:helix-turn-helix domain-containing protein n=1 Tax=Phascolarctobacterium sp. TaxID=2049039 RepID=UPI00386CA810